MSPGDHAAWISARAAVVAAILSGLSTAGVFWAAWIARGAARTWRGVHEASAADECVAAAYDCLGAVDRVIVMRWVLDGLAHPANRAAIQFPEEAFNEAWAAWRRFRIAHVVAGRYHADHLPVDAPALVAEQLNRLQEWCRTYFGRFQGEAFGVDVEQRLVADRRSNEIRGVVEAVAEQITEALRPPAPPLPLRARARALLVRVGVLRP